MRFSGVERSNPPSLLHEHLGWSEQWNRVSGSSNMSRGSQHELMTSGRRRAGRTDSGRVDSGRGGSMKCIVTVGIILPLLAAIIGVVAWTLSSDTLHKRSQSHSQYHGGHSTYRTRDQVFEERNDEELGFGQKLPIGGSISKDILGPDVDVEREVLPSSPQEPPPERDPLYVVHYVPQGKEATSQTPNTEAGHDVLAKILSASKAGQGKGTPQFVVFAPSPDSHEDDDDEDDLSSRVTRKTIRRRKKNRKGTEDYEDDELPAHTQIKQQVTSRIPRPRHGDFDSPDYQHQWPIQHHHQQPTFNQQPNYNPQYNQPNTPCCQQSPPQSTEAPSGGLTIQLGQGLPNSPLGLLRQLLRPKVDLKKKLFFGVQLENGIGFGGETTPAPGYMGGNMGMGGQMGMGGPQSAGKVYRFGR